MSVRAGGLIDRGRPVRFRFDGRWLTGFAGDTLASALLANGVSLVARSFKYHRPRGIMGSGVEEPSALVTVGRDGRREPNTRATDVFIHDGLEATSQNAWPSLRFDIGVVNSLLAPLIPAGFYYKTFFGPPRRWMIYEHFIRRAAGLGKPPRQADPDAYAHRAGFCDVMVVGAGPAGLAAALAAAEAGRRVMLVEQDARAGGALLVETVRIDGISGVDWVGSAIARIRELGGRVLLRSTATGYWDHDLVSVVERCREPGAEGTGVAQRLWKVRCRAVILATGAIERPLAFAGNDRPGVMLARAARTYARRYGVAPGRRAVIVTSQDEGYRTAFALAEAGVEIVAVLDERPSPQGPLVEAARLRFPVHGDVRAIGTRGWRGPVRAIDILIAGQRRRFAADLVAMSGGLAPVLHLFRQAGGDLVWDDATGTFLPGVARQNQCVTGSAAGEHDLAEILGKGWRAGGGHPRDFAIDDPLGAATSPAPAAPVGTMAGKAFVDFQNDVTLADIDLAWREGYRSVEHLKRYTTLGMGTDQGKTGAMPALARLAESGEVTIPEAGLTTFRPPYTPVTMAVFAGAAAGGHAAPIRRLPLHDEHTALGADRVPAGAWFRPRSYPRTGETPGEASLREARAVRHGAGIVDVSTLAKFEIAGPDALALIEAVLTGGYGKLALGRGRYALMLREDGLAMDDGTVWRLGEQRWLLTSSTGGAARMAQHLSYVRDILLGCARVSVVDVQDQWAAIALAGPASPAVIAALTGATMPRHMHMTDAVIAGIAVRLLAASYSGERAAEIHVPADCAVPVWRAVRDAVAAEGGTVYGLDAMDHLRVEKGHVVVGAELDGRVTAADLGLGGLLRRRGGFVGWQGLARPALADPAGRRHLVGLVSLDGPIPEGAMLVAAGGEAPQGHVTTAAPRIAEPDGWIGLGLLRDGATRHGEQMVAWSPMRGQAVPVWITAPMFHDSAGTRYHD